MVSFFTCATGKLSILPFFPAKHAKYAKSLPDEATVLRTSGCPAIDGSKGRTFRTSRPGHPAVRCASGVFTGLEKRPSGQPGICAERSDAQGRPEGRRRKAFEGFPDDGWTDGRADAPSAGGRRDASLFFACFACFAGK
ncbi:MAG: hypothetical protein J5654_01080, partial [Victivallales bacterium]|nr:hypothetical protein [Victivallales bacterium]